VVSNYYDGWTYAWIGQANVLLGVGDGSFSGPTSSWGGYGMHGSGVIGDFNGDGKQDLALTNNEQYSVEVMLGDGLGNLSFAGNAGTSASPWALAAGDVNGDGKLDVVTGNTGGGNVSVLLGDGRGGFSSSQNYGDGVWPLSVVLGDFNRDGQLDIALANGYADSVSVLRGQGNGAFSTAESFAASTGPYALAAADFNGDGWLDAATANADGNSATVLFNDRSWPFVPPTVSVGDAAVTEGNTGTVNVTFTLTLAYPSPFDVTVHYATADGTAAAGSDYVAASGDVTIPAGQTSATVTVAVKGDRLGEPTETFAVNLTAATNATISDGQGIGTILDNEPRISFSNVTQKEGKKNRTTQFTFTITLSAAYDQPVTVSFRTGDGTAKTSDGDYVANTGTITFAPGETTKAITIEVKGDNKREADEYFYLLLFGNSSNSWFANDYGVGRILNDD
jgi:hypothetical protein